MSSLEATRPPEEEEEEAASPPPLPETTIATPGPPLSFLAFSSSSLAFFPEELWIFVLFSTTTNLLFEEDIFFLVLVCLTFKLKSSRLENNSIKAEVCKIALR